MEDFLTSLETEIQQFAEQQERQQKARELYLKKLVINRLRTNHRVGLCYYSMQNSDKNKIQLQTMSSDKAFASRTPLKHLTRTKIQDVRLEIRAEGKYLLLRTLEPSYMVEGIQTIVEDHTGNATLFCAYNMVTEAKEDCQEMFPVGTVFALKEPYYKIPRAGDYMLRCDSPTDIVFVHQRQDYFNLTDGISWKNSPAFNLYPDAEFWKQKTALEWKALGNEMYQKRKFLHATRCYTRGLWEAKKAGDGGDLCKTLHLNLAQAYLSSGWYESAISSAEKVLTHDPSNKKAYFRAGRANYELRKYEESKQCYLQLLRRYPNCKEAQTELKHCESRIMEAKSGNHNVSSLYLEAKSHPMAPMYYADYIGPVRVDNVPGKGRGIVATKNLEPGTLIVVSKALVVAWQDDCALLLPLLANMIRKNPVTFGSAVYDLSVGNRDSNVVSPFCDPESKEEVFVDIKRLFDIIEINSFQTVPNAWDFKCSSALSGHSISGVGLFLFPSLFNHHCFSNAIQLVYNDIMVARTLQPVKEGEEISISYIDVKKSYEQRKDSSRCRGFQCDCRLCFLDEQEDPVVRSQREKLMLTFHNEIKPLVKQPLINERILKLVERMMKDIDMTYKKSGRKELKTDLHFVYQGLAVGYFKLRKYHQAIEALLNVIRIWGFYPHEMLNVYKETGTVTINKSAFLKGHLSFTILSLITCYKLVGDFDRVKTWMEILIKLEEIVIGADVEMIKHKFPELKECFSLLFF